VFLWNSALAGDKGTKTAFFQAAVEN